MTAFFFPDNTALINFHLIGRWDLLEAAVGTAAQWCGSVATECGRSDAFHPGLYQEARRIFGDPVIPQPAELVNTQVLRTKMADPTDDSPTRHLGEAETITIVDARFTGSRFITDDAGARQFAEADGIKCYGTGDLLVVAEKRLQRISSQERAEYEQALISAGRTARYFQFQSWSGAAATASSRARAVAG